MKRALTMLIIGLLCFPTFSIYVLGVKAETGSWTTKAPLPQSQALSGTTVAAGKIYAIGGQCKDISEPMWLDTNYEYDPLYDSWVQRASMPTKRTTLTAVSVDNKIYAIGGAASISGGAFSTNEEFDPLSNSWTVKASMPTPRNWITAAVVNNKVYVIGGTDNSGGVFSMNEEYDPLTDTWTAKSSIPQGSMAYGIGVVNDKIYVIGGWTHSGPIAMNQEYDPQTNAWTMKAPMPTARDGFAVAVVNDKIYAIGGATGNIDPWTNNVDVVEEYDPATDTWRTVEAMPTSRSLLSAAVVGDRIYAIGGLQDTVYLDTNEEFDIGTLRGWELDFTEPTNHPIVDFAVCNGSLYAAADNRLYVRNGSSWIAINTPTYVTSLESAPSPNRASPLAEWNKTYGGTGGEVARSIVLTTDGGYAITGNTFSYGAGSSDFWLVKTDSVGNVQWNKTYGGTGWDEAWALVQTTDGGYAIVGYTDSYGAGMNDFWLVKTDSNGNPQWNQTYGGMYDEWARDLVQTGDGGYALAGETESFGPNGNAGDFWLVKTDSAGNVQWNKTYGGIECDVASALIQTADDGYAVAGFTFSSGFGSHDAWLVKTDSSGNAEWSLACGGASGDFATSLVQTAEAKYVMAGFTNSYGAGGGDFYHVMIELYEDSKERLVVGGQCGLYSNEGTTINLAFYVSTYIKILGFFNNTLYAGTMLADPPRLYGCNGSPEDPINWYEDTIFQSVLDFSGPFGSIDSFVVYNGKMYVASGNTVYCFDGTSWSVALTYEYSYAFLDMQVYEDKLYLATRDQAWRKPLHQGGTGFSGRVIEYDGASWTIVFDHDYWVYSLEVHDGKLYAGTANKILTYNGTAWETSFSATEGAYYAISMITYDGKIYAGMGNGYIFVDPASTKTEQVAIAIPEYSSKAILAIFGTILSVTLTKRKRLRRFC